MISPIPTRKKLHETFEEARMKEGHPPGLRTLFFTEMWERFSYYGMRAMLVLFMVDAVRGGMGLTDEIATAIYGLYTAGVYLAALPGGWLADRVLGARRAVLLGGTIIAAGHFTLAIPWTRTFFLGLILIVLGTGLLKPNISVLVGHLYPEGGSRRDAGFSIFYMGINIGAAFGPLVCGWLRKNVNWHVAFAAAGVGMVFGLLQFWLTGFRLGTAGDRDAATKPLSTKQRNLLVSSAGIFGLTIVLGLAGILRFDSVVLARGATVVIVAVAVLYFGGVYLFGHLNPAERKRVHVIVILFLGSALFWAGFEQAGSSFNLFAERFTDRALGSMFLPARWFQSLRSFIVPAEWFQSFGPAFVILLAPVFASLWVRLGARHKDPSVPVKFGLGLILLGAGFAVMAGAAAVVARGQQAGAYWLITTYLVHTFGELCLSPVGLSSVTKLAPPRFVGQMMGTWFLGSSLGNLIAGLLAGRIKMDVSRPEPGHFLSMVWMPGIAGFALIVLSPVIKRWIGAIR
jgi:proton-dependent oligopeptide transporter, POT family